MTSNMHENKGGSKVGRVCQGHKKGQRSRSEVMIMSCQVTDEEKGRKVGRVCVKIGSSRQVKVVGKVKGHTSRSRLWCR